MKVRSEIPTAENTTNMDGFGTCEVGTTLENLKAAIGGETGALCQVRRVRPGCQGAGLRADRSPVRGHLGRRADPHRPRVRARRRSRARLREPAAPEAEGVQTDLNLIMGAQGEIFETSDMYPAFIKKAQEEGNTKAVQVFTRAKLAESVHAERYLAAYDDIDAPDDDKFYLCPICGYIHKGRELREVPHLLLPEGLLPRVLNRRTQLFRSARNGRPRQAFPTSATCIFTECFT